MPSFDFIKKSPIDKSFRVAKILGQFDMSIEHTERHFVGDLPLDFDWNIGVIAGSSGSGKTSIAKEIFGDSYIRAFDYTAKSVIDDFPEGCSVEDITKTLNSVGFSSPPSWVKPYSVLSTGEQMRVDLARALLSTDDLICFDEFTSVLDRQVATIGCAAIAKGIRRHKRQFVAVSCHYDILEWLEPDWVFDTNSMTFDDTRGRLRRPDINLEVYEQKGFWPMFRRHHYLNTEIHPAARQFVAVREKEIVAFCGVMQAMGVKNTKRVTRLVVLPDYQGLGIGHRLLEEVGRKYAKSGMIFRIITSNPALLHCFTRSKLWAMKSRGRIVPHRLKMSRSSHSGARLTTTWEYIPLQSAKGDLTDSR